MELCSLAPAQKLSWCSGARRDVATKGHTEARLKLAALHYSASQEEPSASCRRETEASGTQALQRPQLISQCPGWAGSRDHSQMCHRCNFPRAATLLGPSLTYVRGIQVSFHAGSVQWDLGRLRGDDHLTPGRGLSSGALSRQSSGNQRCVWGPLSQEACHACLPRES